MPCSSLAAEPDGTQLIEAAGSCAACHTTEELWEGERRRFWIPEATLLADVHLRHGVGCTDCHGGNAEQFEVPEAHATNVDPAESGVEPFRESLGAVRKSCGKCHAAQQRGLLDGVHGKAGGVDTEGKPVPFDCGACHGEKVHGMVPIANSESPVFVDHQLQQCGGCHEEALREYDKSVHGRGLRESGLLVTAVCSSCHGAHGIFSASDTRSQLHSGRVAETCGKCHRFIESRLRESVHGGGRGPGRASEEPALGGDVMRKPSCTDCHQGHDLPDPRSEAFRLRLPDRCGDCHVDLSRRYGMSLHGALTDLGYGPAAKCSDCHGAHDVLPISDSRSRMAVGANRLATCRRCHPGASARFCEFLPHADHEDVQKHPILYVIYTGMELLIISVFAFFATHTALWFVRSLIHVNRHGRPRRLVPGEMAYVRFESFHRGTHAVVIVSFLGLALTGLPLRYSSELWAQRLARGLGGFQSTSLWHHVLGVVTLGYFVAHLIWVARRVAARGLTRSNWVSVIFGPDSPVPNERDFFDFLHMGRWFFGFGPKPVFERWTYWEKFDYWAVFWGVAIIGSSGLMLWFPQAFGTVLSGRFLNVAKIVHSEEALLATSFIFAIHFFGTHLRPEKFPIDMAVLSGLVSEEEFREERPELVERLERAGQLDSLRAVVPERKSLLTITFFGFVAVAVGTALLIGMLLAGFGD